jgi:hypothetical protein
VIAALRKRRKLPKEVRALVEAVELGDADDALRRDWQQAIDGIRVLYHASPVGTARQRNQLLEVARNRKLVGALRVAATAASRLDPTRMAVLIAEGSPQSDAVVAELSASYVEKYSELLRKLELFRGALDEKTLP